MNRYALKVAYDGTDFSGFQVQPAVPTIQGSIERALFEYCGVEIRIAGAGRTDAGVHATGQVVGINLPASPEPLALARAMNALVDHGISIVDCVSVSEDFHPRHSAIWRSYSYLVRSSAVVHPLVSRYCVTDNRPLDFEALSLACKRFVGIHDFGAFARVREDQSPLRNVLEASVRRSDDLLIIDFKAQSFLHQMVRGLVLSALEVAAGRRDICWIDDLLAGSGRVPYVATPKGLCLTAVGYETEIFSGANLQWPLGVGSSEEPGPHGAYGESS